MSKKQRKNGSPTLPLTSEAARQRWELFHRAIAHAKESNLAHMDEAETQCSDTQNAGPLLTIVR
ncbi:MAG: hypothetical protein MUO51_04235 [Woeseiaceae bacterium]|jgi:hypothetical protein|nr:hypothetical protein [Woeseiaceae bacterium]TFG39697.1 MAG: hypothetical protein E4H42_05530 [Chromatiales bacterium]